MFSAIPRSAKIYDQVGFYSDNIDPATAEAYARGGGAGGFAGGAPEGHPGGGAGGQGVPSTSEASTFPIWRMAQAVAGEPAAAADSRISFQHLGGGRGGAAPRPAPKQAPTWNTR